MRSAPPLSTRLPHAQFNSDSQNLSFRGRVSPLHLVRNMLSKIKAMLVMAQERRIPLLGVLESCGIEVVPAFDCNEARRMLETQVQIQAVLTDRALPDGDWREVLEIVAQGRAYVQVVVCSRLGDHTLLIDVLEQGGYDVLVEPPARRDTASSRSCCSQKRRTLPASRPNDGLQNQRSSCRRVAGMSSLRVFVQSRQHQVRTSDHPVGRCHQRDLACATGGGGRNAHPDARGARGDRTAGNILCTVIERVRGELIF